MSWRKGRHGKRGVSVRDLSTEARKQIEDQIGTGSDKALAQVLEADDRSGRKAAQKHEVDGFTFRSAAEVRHYCALKQRRDAGEIADLVMEPTYTLQNAFTTESGEHVRAITYRPDFRYVEIPSGVICVDEVKGFTEEDAKLKIKMFRYHYRGVRFRILKPSEV